MREPRGKSIPEIPEDLRDGDKNSWLLSAASTAGAALSSADGGSGGLANIPEDGEEDEDGVSHTPARVVGGQRRTISSRWRPKQKASLMAVRADPWEALTSNACFRGGDASQIDGKGAKSQGHLCCAECAGIGREEAQPSSATGVWHRLG